MSRETLADVVAFIAVSSIPNLDITGGAPELNAISGNSSCARASWGCTSSTAAI